MKNSIKLLGAAAIICVQALRADTVDCSNPALGGERCLRDAIYTANGNPNWTTIYLGNRQYDLTRSLPDIQSPVTFQGLGAGWSQIHGPCKTSTTPNRCDYAKKSQVFRVLQTGFLRLLNLTVANGIAERGGGIWNDGHLSVEHSTIMKNYLLEESGADGSGIYNTGRLYVADSTINDNMGNCCDGGIYSNGSATIVNSTIYGHGANGLKNAGYLEVKNSTIYGNAKYGIESASGFVSLDNVTLTNNRDAVHNTGGSPFFFSNSIIALNLVARECESGAAPLLSLGGNTYSNAAIAGCRIEKLIPPMYLGWADKVVADNKRGNIFDGEMLPRLADNGGSSCTVALLSASPANDAGNRAGYPCQANDQRGRARGESCDSGAFEHSGPVTPSSLRCPNGWVPPR